MSRDHNLDTVADLSRRIEQLERKVQDHFEWTFGGWQGGGLKGRIAETERQLAAIALERASHADLAGHVEAHAGSAEGARRAQLEAAARKLRECGEAKP